MQCQCAAHAGPASDVMPASIYDKHSVGPSIRPICTKRCFKIANIIQVCGNEFSSHILVQMRSPDDCLCAGHRFDARVPPRTHQQCNVNYFGICRAVGPSSVWSYEFHRIIDGRMSSPESEALGQLGQEEPDIGQGPSNGSNAIPEAGSSWPSWPRASDRGNASLRNATDPYGSQNSSHHIAGGSGGAPRRGGGLWGKTPPVT